MRVEVQYLCLQFRLRHEFGECHKECYPEWKDRMEQKILQGFLLPVTSSLMYELAKFPRD